MIKSKYRDAYVCIFIRFRFPNKVSIIATKQINVSICKDEIIVCMLNKN